MDMLMPRYAWEFPPHTDKRPILRGEQNAGIALRHRDYMVDGRLMIGCTEENPWVAIADITKVRHRLLKDVSKTDWLAAGFVAQDEVFQFFEELYPGKVTWDSDVTVVHWKDIRGRAVEDLRAADNARPK